MGCVHLVLVNHFPHSLLVHHSWLVHRRQSSKHFSYVIALVIVWRKKGLSLFPFDNLHFHSSSKTADLCFGKCYDKYFGHTSFFSPSFQSRMSSKDFTFEVKDILGEFKWIFADLQLTNFKRLMRNILYISLIYCFKTYKETKHDIICSSEYNIICLPSAKYFFQNNSFFFLESKPATGGQVSSKCITLHSSFLKPLSYSYLPNTSDYCVTRLIHNHIMTWVLFVF